jgi:nucleoid DNA-binding protein
MPKVQKKKVKNSLDKIAEKVHHQVDLPKSHIKEVINETLRAIEELLAERESISFVGYFSFSTRKQPAKEMTMRFGKNKGKKIKIPAKIVPAFKFSSALKKRVVK